MKESSHYLHVTGGRLRIKIAQMKNSKEIALKIERLLGNLNGIKSAKANPLTGNLLVLFDSKIVKYEDIVETIKKQGYLEEQKVQRRSVRAPAANRVLQPNYASNIVTDIVLQKAVEITIRQALLALL